MYWFFSSTVGQFTFLEFSQMIEQWSYSLCSAPVASPLPHPPLRRIPILGSNLCEMDQSFLTWKWEDPFYSHLMIDSNDGPQLQLFLFCLWHKEVNSFYSFIEILWRSKCAESLVTLVGHESFASYLMLFFISLLLVFYF